MVGAKARVSGNTMFGKLDVTVTLRAWMIVAVAREILAGLIEVVIDKRSDAQFSAVKTTHFPSLSRGPFAGVRSF